MTQLFSIQEAVRATGLSAHTLRYYERIGLINPITRQANGHRLYRPEDLQWIAFLTRLRSTGMSIEHMLRYAALRRQGDGLSSVSARKRMLDQHTVTLEGKLVALQETLAVLHAKVAFYAKREEALKSPHSSFAQKRTVIMENARYERGAKRLKEVDGSAGERVIASLADISPDFGRIIIEFGFGDIYSRPGLTLQQRELATIAALTALGNAIPQLKVHLAAGLNVGLSRTEIIETIIQMAVYAGFPAALNGLFAAKEVFAEHDGDRP